MAAKKPNNLHAPVASIRHKDKRANIPTEELRDFVAEDEKAPKTMLYPRDPSLDPQLVWKGKDDQDAKDLAVPVVPIYVQEHVSPHRLIDDLRRRTEDRKAADTGVGPQLDLFRTDFNGIGDDFEARVDFYSQRDDRQRSWSNRMILGDSLLVMTSLAEKEGLKGKVQTIYFDPPYGIKFGSNWQVSTRKRDVKDGKAEDCTRQPEQIRAFRDCWRIGVHSYLAYIRDILTVARELLTETGGIFVQISDENVHLVRCVLDEILGSENQIATICVQKTGSTDQLLVPQTIDYLLFYAKNKEIVKYRQLYQERMRGTLALERYDQVLEKDGALRRLTAEEIESNEVRGGGVRAQLTSLSSARPLGEGDLRQFKFNGITYTPGGGTFKTDDAGMTRLVAAGRAKPAGQTLRYLRLVDDFPVVPLNDRWDSVQLGTGLIYVVQTSPKVIERCLLMTTDPGDLVLDPTCGSGTTAFVAEQWGRRWITVDTSRVALALARTRLMTAKYPYYLLADSAEGVAKEAELSGKTPPAHATEGDIKKGFVYERVPHVTLKSIANNPDIREGMSRAEIDAAIARHADTETLFDKPYLDFKRIRVSGPFTVESLSPHRVLAAADDNLDGTVSETEARKQQDFATMILDNLRKAGVQNTKKGERLVFERLDPHAGTWIHATGEYAEMPEGGTARGLGQPAGEVVMRRVAVSIGPEHGTVGPMQVKEAAKEAVQGVGHDLLIVCGFAFDPHVAEEAKRYGKLTVLAAKMNPDLAMGDELLKKTGAGNLFMVFGEPDIDLQKQKDGTLVAEIRGLDVYDPTTGAIRSSSTDDIACWFIDTDYNGESFFVRHAYFTGAAKGDDGPYDKLKRALRAEIDEAAWSSLYSTTSRPFAKPQTGKIAVKVINHYGDEVLKVFEV
ncbi:MAG TPA: site-specific DNA-methyltransferase [Phycisphaerae bacterium]|nr:site-specific DNA-methyltransferase [Phycisphaerae bacterium]